MPDRPWHLLRPVKGERVPDVCVFVDTESYPDPVPGMVGVHDLRFRCGVATAVQLERGEPTSERTLPFVAPEQFWNFLQQQLPRSGILWVFSHNVGFDFTLLGGWRQLDHDPPSIRELVLEDPPTIVSYRVGRVLVRWVDTLNYWRAPLATLGEDLGLCKLEMPQPEAPLSDWFEYCKQDVNIIKEAVCRLIHFTRETLCCSFRPTAASLSWFAWRRSLTFPKVVIHGNYRALALERRAVFGGRLECCKLGSIPHQTTALDVTSLYPHVMSTQPLPFQLVSLVRDPIRSDVRAWMREYHCVADCTLVSGHPPFPQRLAGGIVFGGGEGRFVLCGPELMAAFQSAAVRTVHQCALYATKDLFAGFLEPLLDLKARARRVGKVADELCTKLICNALSGKFAQRGRKWIYDDTLTAPDRWSIWWRIDPKDNTIARCRAIAGRTQRLVEGHEPRDTLPIISASIAASGRCALESYYQLAGASEVLYCDTDAIHVLGAGKNRLDRNGAIADGVTGKLRITHEGEDSYYWGKKHYRIGAHVVCGGRALDAKEIASGVWLQHNFAGIDRILESGAPDSVRVTERVLSFPEI